jgi:hypothetical protein
LRIGRMVLGGGAWQGKQIVLQAWAAAIDDPDGHH